MIEKYKNKKENKEKNIEIGKKRDQRCLIMFTEKRRKKKSLCKKE